MWNSKLAFVECTTCHVWADLPKNFNETKHFAQCPRCLKPMYLARGIDPINELGFRLDRKVTAGLMSQKGY